MKKTTFILIILIILGFLLRITVAINMGYAADDVTHAIHAINFTKSGKLADYSQSSSLWHYTTDVFYKIFGVGQFSSRIPSIIFGTLSILLIFLLTKEFFGKKAGIIAALLLATSPFHLKFTISEMDVMASFFVLISIFLFVKAIKTENNLKFIISGIFLGLGILTKLYPLLFIPVLVIFGLYKNYKIKGKIFDKKIIKGLILFLGVAFIFCIPMLANNYLLYKDKGIMDFIFTQSLGLGKEKAAQFYSWDAGWGAKHDWKGFFLGNSRYVPTKTPASLHALGYVLFSDYIVFILGVLGLAYCCFKKRSYLLLFCLIFLFVFSYLASIILLSKHYLFLLIFLIPPAAVLISKIPIRLRYIMIFILVFNLIFLGYNSPYTPTHFYGTNAIAKTIDFKDKNIGENSLIVLDSRIYRARTHWISYNRPYLEGTQFIQIVNIQDQIPGEIQPIDVYYIECVIDDCGWGGISKQPELNQSMEYLTLWFNQTGNLIAEINEPNRNKFYYPIISNKNKMNMMNIYKAKLNLKSGILDIANQPKNWFLYNVGYVPKGSAFDDYEVNGFFDKTLDKFAHLIIWVSLILAFASSFYVIYLVWKEVKDEPPKK